MCLIVFAHRPAPAHRLILAANRDEFYHRPSRPLDFWDDAPGLLAGRDLDAGGTWLGVTRSGRWGALTNIRDPDRHRRDAPSRGALASDFLRDDCPPGAYLARVAGRARRYNGFNLLVGDAEGVLYFDNCSGRPPRSLAPGLYGLSNAGLDTPWPKVSRARRGLAQLLAAATTPTPQALLELLADRRVPPDAELPDTGVGLARERALAPLFIETPDYGTRCSSALRIDADGTLDFTERDARSGADRRFLLPPPAAVPRT